MKINIHISILILALVILSAGCAVGPNYQKTDLALPGEFENATAENDSLQPLSWWELFKDPELDTLIRIAIEYNKDALIATQRIEESRNILGFTKADIYPRIDISAEYSYSNQLSQLIGENADQGLHQFNAALPFNWEIDFWGKFRRANEAARAELVASEFGYRAVMISLIAQVTEAYITLLDFKNRLDISKRTLASRRESVRIIQERFNEGYVAEIDLNQAQIQEGIAASAVPNFERLIAITQNSLNVLLGRYPQNLVTSERLYDIPIPEPYSAGIPAQLVAQRPDVLEAEYFVVAQNARIGAAQAQRFPAISITGLIGIGGAGTSFTADNVVWSAGGTLLGPLFNFGKNKRRVDIERTRFEQAKLTYENLVLNAVAEVENSLISIETYSRELEAVNYRMNAAINASNLSYERYNGGVTSYLEVLDSERSKFDAELRASETYSNFLFSYLDLYLSLGGGWITEAERNNANTEEGD